MGRCSGYARPQSVQFTGLTIKKGVMSLTPFLFRAIPTLESKAQRLQRRKSILKRLSYAKAGDNSHPLILTCAYKREDVTCIVIEL
jgi:hypothetical protein